jgi:hypothetical protein
MRCILAGRLRREYTLRLRSSARISELLAPFHPGDEVVPGARLVGVLLELGLG